MQEKTALLRSDILDEGYVLLYMETAVGNTAGDMKEYFQTHIKSISTKKILHAFVKPGTQIIAIIDKHIPNDIKMNASSSLTEMITGYDRHVFRIKHYPPIEQLTQKARRAGAHTDICLLTIIPFATGEGLELEDSNRHWHKPKIKEDEILVFNGDNSDCRCFSSIRKIFVANIDIVFWAWDF